MITRSVLAVDDEPIYRRLIASALRELGFEVHTASTAVEAMRVVDAIEPDLALLDVDLGTGPDGLQLSRRIAMSHPDVVTVLLTRFSDPDSLMARRVRCPASGVLCKTSLESPDELAEALDRFLRGAQKFGHPMSTTPFADLTRAQVEVLRLAAAGLTNFAIAEARG